MSTDISRKRFKPRKHYSGVVMQQGRVQLDADWNENVAIRDRRDRSETYDTFGGCAVPQTTPDAFEIQAVGGTLEIGPGRMYVDGLQAENHGAVPEDWDRHLAEERGANPVEYGLQPYLPEADTEAPLPVTPGTHLAFLDVWEREVNHLIDPDLVEKAVGVDTTARTQTIWQVKVLANVGDINCATPDEDVPGWIEETAPSAGRLTTGTLTNPPDPNPCLLPPTGGYKGLENHTYRVEIHDAGVPLEPGDSGDPPPAGSATFKWSRDNGIVASEVTAIPALDRIRLASLGRDEFLRFHDGEWVEVTDDLRELHGRPGFLSKITVDVANSELILEAPLPAGEFPVDPLDDSTEPLRHTRARRWDQSGLVEDTSGNDIVDLNAALAAGSIPVPPAGTPIELEAGVVVTFETPSGGRVRTGDAWVFAARTVDASVEELIDEPPCAIHHHYCRLALIHQPTDGDPEVTDCRHPWGCGCCCEIRVAPGRDVQAAIDRIPPEGGVVCLEVGVHRLRRALRIDDRRNLVVRGCGPGSKLVLDRTDGETTGGAVIHIAGASRNIGIETLSIFSDQSAHLVSVDEESLEVTVSETVLVNATGSDRADCVVLGDCGEVTVERSKLLGRNGVIQASAEILEDLREELENLRPETELEVEEPGSVPPPPADDVIPPSPPPTVETIKRLRIEDNLILGSAEGVALLDVLGGRIRDNRILPAMDRRDGFQRPQETPTPAGVPVDEFETVSAEDEFFEDLHEAFDALVWEEVDAEDLSEMDAGIEACLLERVAVTGNSIQAEVGCRLRYSRGVSVSGNQMRVEDSGVATGYAFDLVVEDNRIVVVREEEPPANEPQIDLTALGLPRPSAAGVNLDIARGVRISRNEMKAPSGLVARRSSRSGCPPGSGPSLLRVLGVTKLWRVVVEFAWILLQIVRLLDPENESDQGPTKTEFEQKLLAGLIGVVTGKIFPAFVGKAMIDENLLCVERFGILARQILTVGGLRVVANRVTGARFSGIEIKPLFSIGLVDTISRWVGCILGFIIRILQLFYRALCRFLEGQPMPDPQGGADAFTTIGVTAVSGFMSLCARICGDPSDGGDGDPEDGERPTPEDLKDALGDLLDGSCWLDDLLDGAYRISRNTVRGGGTGIWTGIDGTRVDGNRITVDPDDPVAWEAVVLGLLLAGTDEVEPQNAAVANALMDLDRESLLFGLFDTENPLEAPSALNSVIGTYASLVPPESPLSHWVIELEGALTSGTNPDQAWRNLLAVIWGELRGYGIVLAGGDFCCTDNRVDAEKVCLSTRRAGQTEFADLRRMGKPPAVGGIWQVTSLAGFFVDVFRLYRSDPGKTEQMIGTVTGLILAYALGKADNRELEVSDNQVREALVHGISTRAVAGLRVVDFQDNHVCDAGRIGILFRGEGGTVRAHANAVRRTAGVYGFLEFQNVFRPGFARLIEVGGGISDKLAGTDILASQNYADGSQIQADTSAVRLIGDSVGVIANHLHTDGLVAFEIVGHAGLFTDNMSNTGNQISGVPDEAPNPINLP